MTLIQVNSSAIRAVGYDGYTLTVEFHTGRIYDHPGVPYEVYRELMNASSMGAYYSRYIRGEVSVSASGSSLAKAKTMLSEMVAEAQELKAAAGGSVTDAVAAWLAPQYLLAAREKLDASEGPGRLEVLQTILHDWTLLRRGDHSAARLQLDREELEWQRTNSQAQKEKEFREWIQRPEIREELLPELTRGISKETLKKIEAELHLL